MTPYACPKCSSEDLKGEPTVWAEVALLDNNERSVRLVTTFEPASSMLCKNCNHIGQVFHFYKPIPPAPESETT